MSVFEDPFDKIHEDIRSVFRPQREWINRQGLVLVAAHFLSGIGAGAWAMGWFLQSNPGLFLGFLAVAASGLAHLFFLGTPLRFWRMITRPQASWISRGFIGISLFLPSSFLYLVTLNGGPSPFSRAMLTISLLSAGLVIFYKGFVYASARPIPFWNSPILPPLYILYAVRGGAALIMLSLPFLDQASIDLHLLEVSKFWIVLSSAVLILFYLLTMSASGVGARHSVREILRGQVVLPFYLGVVLVGLLIPLGVGARVFFDASLGVWAMFVVAVASLVGDFFIVFTINRAGIYVPLVGRFPASSRVKGHD